ncbi:hypothetical protein C9374_008589 [Naegleria lovaniensis]|uniref:Uncharacterized protein n=1 Tax=Naegleria lovaniensis TaxID=51637 RepID=A0AA88KF22_NAELO|nr:uncharacterized protein C9374_008589 [Naegleria lovaniensis]KAG2377967.1 hypothetical protein C9374_008589 [Naegleria lovaniensis]
MIPEQVGLKQEQTKQEQAKEDNGTKSSIENSVIAKRSREFFRLSHYEQAGGKSTTAIEEEKQMKEQEALSEQEVLNMLVHGGTDNENLRQKTSLIQTIHDSIIGDDEVFKSPFGYRKITYCDYTASGRSLSFLEEFMKKQVMTMYANTHTTSSITGLQSTLFRHEARYIVRNALNCGKKDVLIFTGSGSTSAVNKLVHLLGLQKGGDMNLLLEKRKWEKEFNIKNNLLEDNFRQPQTNSPFPSDNDQFYDDYYNIENGADIDELRPVVFVGPMEHHSNILPWRESCCHIVPIKLYIPTTGSTATRNEVADLEDLENKLKHFKNGKRQLIGVFSAASNVTGVLEPNVNKISILMHKYGGYVVWDYAAAAPYVKMDMNPRGVSTENLDHTFGKITEEIPDEDKPLCYKDALVFSPHKFVGGPGTPGVLVVKKHMFKNKIPENPGGGTVFFVTDRDHHYVKKSYEREEGGTPEILGSVRCGLVFQLRQAVGTQLISQIETDFTNRAFNEFKSVKNLVILGHGQNTPRLPIFSFLIRHHNSFLPSTFVSILLNDLFGIQTRSGCACAGPFAHFLFGLKYSESKNLENVLLSDDDYEFLRPGFVRLNFNYFMDEDTFVYITKSVKFVAEHGYKFLPYYYFYPETGEWLHNQNRKFPTRRWLQNISYKNGKLEYRQEIGYKITSPSKEYEKYLKHAEEMADQAVKEFSNPKFRIVDQDLLLLNKTNTNLLKENSIINKENLPTKEEEIDHAEKWRWFVFPKQIVEELQGGDIHSIFKASYLKPWTGFAVSEQSVSSNETASTQSRLIHSTLTSEINPVSSSLIGVELPSSSTQSTETNVQVEPSSSTLPTSSIDGFDIGEDDFGGDWKKESTAKPYVQKRPVMYSRPVNVFDHETNKEIILSDEDDKKRREALKKHYKMWPKVDAKTIMGPVKRAIREYDMIRDGDRLLLGLSGGKDSLTLLHVLHALQYSNLGVKFEFGACTVDPQTASYDPSPLINYCKQLGVPYFYESQSVIEGAKECNASSICAWCARMKRGILYNTARREGYNVLVLGQHCDDLAESFIMSIFHNGYMRTMKAHYTIDAGDLRVIRPLIYVRESETKKFAWENKLPVINENCPACFEIPKERARIKTLLANQELIYPQLFLSLQTAMKPLMSKDIEVEGHKKFKSAKPKFETITQYIKGYNANEGSSSDDSMVCRRKTMEEDDEFNDDDDVGNVVTSKKE